MKRLKYTQTVNKQVALPSMDDLIAYMQEQTNPITKKTIARDFKIRGDARKELKSLLKELRSKGLLQTNNRDGGRYLKLVGELSSLCEVKITHQNEFGELMAQPLKLPENTPMPSIVVTKNLKSAVGIGDEVLARLKKVDDGEYEAVLIKKITTTINQFLGVFEDGFVTCVDRRVKETFELINPPHDLQDKDLVVVDVPVTRQDIPTATFVKKIGTALDPYAATLISIYLHKIPVLFPDCVQKEVKKLDIPPLDAHRTDLRDIAFVTIDGDDAKDFDDAVFAELDTNKDNPGGYHVFVAIADVSWYVKTDSHLDIEAKTRGNSVYFADRVVPMLPFELSNGVCSLNPNEDRGALVCEMWLNSQGHKIKHKFVRALIKSKARLTYNQVQKALDGVAPIAGLEHEIDMLHDVYLLLTKLRKKRGAIELNIPERRVVLDDTGNISGFKMREQLTSMKLIEELMILANVSSAETLEKAKIPTMYRVHDRPSDAKLHSLNTFLKSLGMMEVNSATKSITPHNFNNILGETRGSKNEYALQEFILRSQSQAFYSANNLGHFGLGLTKYAHFTSPIRRYADLMVHRALVKSEHLGKGALTDITLDDFQEIAAHISYTERQASAAEQDATDRYVAKFLESQVGSKVKARVCSIHNFGLFVKLLDTMSDAYIPMRGLADDYYEYDIDTMSLVGEEGNVYTIGDVLDVVIADASAITGGVICHVIADELNTNYYKKQQKRQREINKKEKRAKRKKKRLTEQNKKENRKNKKAKVKKNIDNKA